MSTYSKLLIPVDLSDRSRAAVETGLDLARQTGAAVEIVHVVTPERVPVAPVDHMQLPPLEASMDHAQEYLGDFVASLDSSGVEITSSLITGEPSVAILDHAEATSPDVIVMSTHGHTGLMRLVMGSQCEAVLRRAQVPVLTVRTEE